MKPQKLISTIIMLAIAPLLYIAAFNSFFDVGIPWTIDSWFLVFLVGMLTFILFMVLFLLVILGGAALAGPFGFILGLVVLFALPVLFIISFNVLLATTVPITVTSYGLVALTMIGVWVISTVVEGVK